jgi:hypothetical protein
MMPVQQRLTLAIAVVVAAVALALLLFVTGADAHYYSHCAKPKCKYHVFAPYKRTFLGPVGACESGTHSHSLYAGLRAISPGGTYRGRYQFGWADWARAGGHGDPAAASANEQAYRAVVWLHRNGRQSWPNC